MSDAGENVTPIDPQNRLAASIRSVKNAIADRDDVVVDMREAHRMRLELLASELAPVFSDVPTDIDNFDFTVSSGLQPRLWIDAVSHVAMGRDRRTYRFLKDTRVGRVVLAESTQMKPIVDQVTLYVAERIIERERMMENGAEPATGIVRTPVPEVAQEEPKTPQSKLWSAFLTGLALIAAGALVGLVFSLVLFWDRIAAMKISF